MILWFESIWLSDVAFGEGLRDMKRNWFAFLLLSVASLLLNTCAQYQGRYLTLGFVTIPDASSGTDPYSGSTRRMSGKVVFKDVRETDTLRQVFERVAVSNGWNPETEGIGPWTWLRKDGTSGDLALFDTQAFQDTYMGSAETMGLPERDQYYGFKVVVGEDSDYRKYITNWGWYNGDDPTKMNRDKISNIRFYKDTSFNVFTTGIDEPLGDCIAIYPKYEMSFSGNNGEFYLLFWKNILNEDGDDLTSDRNYSFVPVLQRFLMGVSSTDTSYTFPSLVGKHSGDESYAVLGGPDHVSESKFVIDNDISFLTPDINGDEGKYSKQLYYVLESFYKTLPYKNSGYLRSIGEIGFKYNRDVARAIDVSTSDGKRLAKSSYPFYRKGDDSPLQKGDAASAANDINETTGNYVYLFNGLFSKAKLMDAYGVLEWSDELQTEYEKLRSRFGAEEYYVLKPGAGINKGIASENKINPLVSRKFAEYYSDLCSGGELFKDGFDGTLRVICPGDVLEKDGDWEKTLSGRILVPKYMMPAADVTVGYDVSAIDPDPAKGGVGIEIDGDKKWVTNSGDPAIDGKGYPKGEKMEAVVTVRVGALLGDVREAIIDGLSDDPEYKKEWEEYWSEREEIDSRTDLTDYEKDDMKRRLAKPDGFWWPVDIDPLSYLVESRPNVKPGTDDQYDLYYPVSLQIIDYNKNPDDAVSDSDYYLPDSTAYGQDNLADIQEVGNVKGRRLDVVDGDYVYQDGSGDESRRDEHLVYRTYDFARELLYGWRDYADHGKRHFFDLRRQGMVRNDDNVVGGGEWEVRGDAPEMVGGYYVDNRANLMTSDLADDKYARPVKGDLYQILSDISIRPFYIDAGYAPIARRIAQNPVSAADAYGGDDIDSMRRLDLFANFIYIPGAKSGSYPGMANTDDVASARRKWGVPTAPSDATTVETVQVYLDGNFVFSPLSDGSAASSGKKMYDFEVMEIPMSFALMYALGTNNNMYAGWNSEQKDFIASVLKGKDAEYDFPRVAGDSTKYWSGLPLLSKSIRWPLDGKTQAEYSADKIEWNGGMKYRIARQLCNLMTDNYNSIYHTNLTPAYVGENLELKPGADGFRLPTAEEYDYAQRIVTQRQQIAPDYKEFDINGKKYYVEQRVVPRGGDGDFYGYGGAFGVVSWESSQDKNGDVENNTDIRESFIESDYEYDFHSSRALPGLRLLNYDRNDWAALDCFKDVVGWPLRDIFDVTTMRYDQGNDWLYNSGGNYPVAKLTLNVRAGSGAMDFLSSYSLVEPNSASGFLESASKSYLELFKGEGWSPTDYAKGIPSGLYTYSTDPTNNEYDPIVAKSSAVKKYVNCVTPESQDYEYDPDSKINKGSMLVMGHPATAHPYYASWRKNYVYNRDKGAVTLNSTHKKFGFYLSTFGESRKANYDIGRLTILDPKVYQLQNFRVVRSL